ncbi:unnamed protein product, partial [marine sediment metagenome]
MDFIYLEKPARPPKAETKTGRIKCLAISNNLPQKEKEAAERERSPEMGSQPNFIPNRIMRSRANQKVGVAKP